MKKLTTIMILAVLVMALTQCRKAIEPVYNIPENNNEKEKITFTLNASSGTNGAKTEITQVGQILNVTWSDGDKIYLVGASDGYLGCLTIQAPEFGPYSDVEKFTGEVPAFDSQVLYFYYLGKQYSGDNTAPLDLNAETFTVDFGNNQNGTLDRIEQYFHLAYGKTATAVTGYSSTETSATLDHNMIAIAKFDLSEFKESTTMRVYGTNVFKTGTINLKTGGFVGTVPATSEESILLADISNSAEAYVAIIPPASSDDKVTFSFNDGNVRGNNITDRVLEAGYFYSDKGNGVKVIPGTNGGLFTVGLNADNTPKKIYIANGNLEDDGEGGYKLADNGYDYGALMTYPTYDNILEIAGIATRADWRLFNGSTEWETLMISRVNADKLFGFGRIKTGEDPGDYINGIIFLPDNWDIEHEEITNAINEEEDSFINNSEKNQYEDNTYTQSEWKAMEAKGAVFFPAAGIGLFYEDTSTWEYSEQNIGGTYMVIEGGNPPHVYEFCVDLEDQNYRASINWGVIPNLDRSKYSARLVRDS